MQSRTQGPAIHEAKVWMTANFEELLNRIQAAFSDGTRGQDDIVEAIRPAAFGAATFVLSDDFVFDEVAVMGGGNFQETKRYPGPKFGEPSTF